MQRQYSGTAGRIENCQLGVFLTYTSVRGRALIDRELYLPTTWTEDRDRCAGAGIGQEVEFATKPALARKMLERLLATHGRDALPWFTADDAYGDNPGLRDWLEEQDLNYVMAISCDARFMTPAGPRRADELAGHQLCGVSRHVGAGGVVDRGRTSRSFIRGVLHLDVRPPVYSETSSPTRRDIHARPPSCGRPTPHVCH